MSDLLENINTEECLLIFQNAARYSSKLSVLITYRNFIARITWSILILMITGDVSINLPSGWMKTMASPYQLQ